MKSGGIDRVEAQLVTTRPSETECLDFLGQKICAHAPTQEVAKAKASFLLLQKAISTLGVSNGLRMFSDIQIAEIRLKMTTDEPLVGKCVSEPRNTRQCASAPTAEAALAKAYEKLVANR